MRRHFKLTLGLVLGSAALAACVAPDDPDGSGGSSNDGNTDGSNDGSGVGGSLIDPGPGPIIDPDDGTGGSGLGTNEILVPECESDCLGFSDPSDDAVGWVVSEGVSDAEKAELDAGGTLPLCVSEPADGTLFPAGWTRPRFAFAGAGPAKVVLSTPRMRHALTIYSATVPVLMPDEAWQALSLSVYNEDITYVVTSDGASATGTFQIVPVAAGGSMVFWGSEGVTPGETTNALYGFGVGDEGVIRAMYPGEIGGAAISDNANLRSKDVTTQGHSTCVGCHTSTPDGKAVASMDDWSWNLRLYSIEEESAGEAPDYLTGAGAAMLSMTWLGGATFSAGDWTSGARRMVTTWSERVLTENEFWRTHDGSVLSNDPTQLVWMDLASTTEVPVDISRVTPADYVNEGQGMQRAVAELRGTGWEVIPRTGDTNYPVMPDWSHDGSTIVYTSTDRPQDGRIGGAEIVDLYTVPFNSGAGGDAEPVSGADSADFEYYPDFSPDDELLAFNKLAAFATNPSREDSFDHVYYRPDSDIYVIPSIGGTATRLASNDAACDGTTGQLYNSWAKWAPSHATDDASGRSYYFLIFSTARNSPFDINRGSGRTSPASQLYMTTVIVEEDGSITSGPAIYLWNQRNLVTGTGSSAEVSELLTNNVTPAWDEFQIPPVPPVVVK
jgi:hypothetical protein